MYIELLKYPEYYVYFNYTSYYESCSSFEKELLIMYRYIYITILMILKPFFNATSFYYQAMLVCLVVYLFRVFKDKNLYKDSSITWLFLVWKKFITNHIDYITFFSYWLNKVTLFLNYISFNIFHYCRYFLSFVWDFFKKYNPFFLWRPIFKKTSYFGIFSNMRSKWFKKKK